jgi:hypothetical protein
MVEPLFPCSFLYLNEKLTLSHTFRISVILPWIDSMVCQWSPKYCGQITVNVFDSSNPAEPLDSSTIVPPKLICQDPTSFVYYEAEKDKRKTYTCSWVKLNAEKQCRNFESYCPVACGKCSAV